MTPTSPSPDVRDLLVERLDTLVAEAVKSTKNVAPSHFSER